jgi:hypothetical protein
MQVRMGTKRVDHSKMKLGKLPPKHDERTFRLSTYLRREHLSPIPRWLNWGRKIEPGKWGMMKNKHIHNCTCAAAGHFIMTWTSNTGKLCRPKDSSILQVYSALTGYDPETGMNDTGTYSIDVLKHWRKNDIDGHKIFAFASVDPLDHRELKETIYLFGGCYAGLGLPMSSIKQPVWEVPPEGPIGDGEVSSWGGHAVLITGYSKQGLKAITWGKEKIMTWDFWNTYCQESFAVLSDDFIKNNRTPAGIDLEALRADLQTLKQK